MLQKRKVTPNVAPRGIRPVAASSAHYVRQLRYMVGTSPLYHRRALIDLTLHEGDILHEVGRGSGCYDNDVSWGR